MQEYERKQFLERIQREGATVGASIPESIEVQGETLDLREFVFEVKRLDRVPADMQDEVEEAKRNLRRERLQRKQKIEHGEVSREKAEELVEAVVGIDRALNALESLGPTDLEAEADAQERMDQKRWLSFLKQVLGKDSGSRRGGR